MLYPVLQRLEKENLISSRWIVSEEGRPRKYYKITASGREALTVQIAQWRSMIEALNLILKTNPEME